MILICVQINSGESRRTINWIMIGPYAVMIDLHCEGLYRWRIHIKIYSIYHIRVFSRNIITNITNNGCNFGFGRVGSYIRINSKHHKFTHSTLHGSLRFSNFVGRSVRHQQKNEKKAKQIIFFHQLLWMRNRPSGLQKKKLNWSQIRLLFASENPLVCFGKQKSRTVSSSLWTILFPFLLFSFFLYQAKWRTPLWTWTMKFT